MLINWRFSSLVLPFLWNNDNKITERNFILNASSKNLENSFKSSVALWVSLVFNSLQWYLLQTKLKMETQVFVFFFGSAVRKKVWQFDCQMWKFCQFGMSLTGGLSHKILYAYSSDCTDHKKPLKWLQLDN